MTALKAGGSDLVSLCWRAIGHYTASEQKYDQHEAIMFGIASADYKPGAAKELIEHEARKKWPNDPRHQHQYTDEKAWPEMVAVTDLVQISKKVGARTRAP